MSEKQTKLLEFEKRMEMVDLEKWTESEIRAWLALRERASEDRRRAITYPDPLTEWIGNA
jgi:hypothetical protein